MRFISLAVICAALLLVPEASVRGSEHASGGGERELLNVLRMQEDGMLSRSRRDFSRMAEEFAVSDPEGYAVLNDVMMKVPGYEPVMNDFLMRNPQSVVSTRIRWQYALNLFDAQEYGKAGEVMSSIELKDLYRGQRGGYLFRKAYCDLEKGDLDAAAEGFRAVESASQSDFTVPSRYALGYICYLKKDFGEAMAWFEKSRKDPRFRGMSCFYIMECRFMLGDHEYVTTQGDAMYGNVPEELRPQLARLISESWMLLGDAANARKYLELNSAASDSPGSRSDLFFKGTVLYASEDYRGAVDAFEAMGELQDSIGQVAAYHLAYSYIQTKNKVAAMESFRNASSLPYDKAIAEDAYFNWAKLAFDLNNDTSVFQSYLKKYSDLDKGDRINSYIAVAALHDRDYEGAINAYDQIDDLDDDMRSNYMKANYLRASQLISNGSYRKAEPCLKVAAYYSKRNSRFNQLSRFWLAESMYRNDQYREARELFMELYNASALYGEDESYLIPYNIAYCYFKDADYKSAMKWFDTYLGEEKVKYRKEALERRADCHFIGKDYKAAAKAYGDVLDEYFDADDIYPYYQCAVASGLDKDVDRKISLLSNVLDASPSSQFYPEALFELGRTYAVMEDDDNAFKCFRTIADVVKDSTFVAKAYIEMGSLSRNQSQFNDALDYYMTVVEKMPLSGYSEDALAAIESIYQTRNEPEKFLAYIESIGKGSVKTADEKEDMIFNSAEQIFLSDNYEKALVSLRSYLDRYPEGRHGYKAHFYIAESFKNLGRSDQACDSYRKVIEEGSGSFVELSMLNFANLSYRMERWDDAYGGYQSLHGSALLENNRFLALCGMMRSAYKGHKWEDAIRNAALVTADSRSDDSLKTEADYIKAKSYLATSRRDEALDILKRLAGDVSDVYGAEAAYILIQDSYDRGLFEDVENKVYAFSDAGSGHMLWLAKSFIVLGDSFAERGELEQAKATFESVRDGYSSDGSDDVLDDVEMRLKRLETMIDGQN